MGDWKITGKSQSTGAKVAEAMTLGLYSPETRYEVVHKATGETKSVNAYSEKGAAEKIAKGKFNKD